MDTAFIDRFMNSEIVRKILEDDDFDPAATVAISTSRDDHDWTVRVAGMRQYCEANKTGRWRSRAPIRDDAVFFDFESERDAVLFKLKFG